MKRQNIFTIILWLIIVSFLSSPFLFGQEDSDNKWVQRYYERKELFRTENEILKRYFPKQKTLVLLGSSSCEHFFKYNQLPGAIFALNRGISGDEIGLGRRGILNRLEDSVYGANPAHVFILNGRNNLAGTMGSGWPRVSSVINCYEKVVQGIIDNVPEAKIHIIACFPVRGEKYSKMAPYLKEYNEKLFELATKLKTNYISLDQEFMGEDGLLLKKYDNGDGLHINRAAHRVWAKVILKEISQEIDD